MNIIMNAMIGTILADAILLVVALLAYKPLMKLGVAMSKDMVTELVDEE